MDQLLSASSDLYKIFLFECLVARLHASSLDRALELSRHPKFDWGVCLQAADEELITPILHDILQDQPIIPAAVQEALTSKHEYIARRNLFLLHQLATILALLQEAGIEAIVLKGAALAETVYQNIALRPMRDLDLLVHHDQQQAAVALLATAGYSQKTAMLGDAYPIALAKAGIEPIELELHWTLIHSLYYHQQLSMDWFWQTAYSIHSAAQSMLVLGDEAQILHLCGHLALHHTHQPQLLWRNDLAELIFHKKEEIRWDLLINKAETFQLLLPLQQILLPLARDWGAPVPQEALQALQALEISEPERQAFALSTAVKQSEGQGYWFRWREIPGRRKRLVYVLKWLFPAPAALRARYGVSRPYLLPLAYPYHWWVGLRLGVEGVFTRQRQDGKNDAV